MESRRAYKQRRKPNDGRRGLMSYDHLVSAGKYRWRNREAKCLGGFKIDHKFVLGRRLYGQVHESAFGPGRTSATALHMSAFGSEAGMARTTRYRKKASSRQF